MPSVSSSKFDSIYHVADIKPSSLILNIFCSGPGLVACTNCSLGTYKTRENGTCEICPEGYECPTTTSDPVICDAGEYRYKDLLIEWIFFTKSLKYFYFQIYFQHISMFLYFYVFSGSGQISCTTCPLGTYKTASGNGTCEICSAGYECPTKIDPPAICAAGKYRYKMH